jgi:hypothetical protein
VQGKLAIPKRNCTGKIFLDIGGKLYDVTFRRKSSTFLGKMFQIFLVSFLEELY